MGEEYSNPYSIENISSFEGIVADLKASIKDGYREVQEKFGDKAPTLQEYIKNVQGRFTELVGEKNLVL